MKVQATILKRPNEGTFITYQDFDERRAVTAKLEELDGEQIGELLEKVWEDRKKELEVEDFSGATDDYQNER